MKKALTGLKKSFRNLQSKQVISSEKLKAILVGMTELGAIADVQQYQQADSIQGRTKFYNEVMAFAKEKNIVIELSPEEKMALQTVGVDINALESTQAVNKSFFESATELVQSSLNSWFNFKTTVNNTTPMTSSAPFKPVDSTSQVSDGDTEIRSSTSSNENQPNQASVDHITAVPAQNEANQLNYANAPLIDTNELIDTPFNEATSVLNYDEHELYSIFNPNLNEIESIDEESFDDPQFQAGRDPQNLETEIEEINIEEEQIESNPVVRITQEAALKDRFFLPLINFITQLEHRNLIQQDKRIATLINSLNTSYREFDREQSLDERLDTLSTIMQTLETAETTFQYETGILRIIQPILNAVSDLMAFLSSMVLSAESHQSFVGTWCQKPEPIANTIYKTSRSRAGFFSAEEGRTAIENITQEYASEGPSRNGL